MLTINILTGYIIWNVPAEIFPGLAIPRWYGLCWALGIMAAIAVMRRILSGEKRASAEVDTLTIYLISGTLIGARLGHILFYEPLRYWKNPIEILPFSMDPAFHFTGLAGLASHGGGIGLVIAAFLYARKYDVPLLWLLDRIAVIVPLCGFFIRFGNLMNSEMIGIPTDLPWAFVFTSIDQLPRHPAQLYESIYCLLLFIVAYQSWRLKSHQWQPGTILCLVITTLFSLRFLDEFFKVNQEAFEDNMLLNMGQLLSIPFIAAGILLLIVLYKKRQMHVVK